MTNQINELEHEIECAVNSRNERRKHKENKSIRHRKIGFSTIEDNFLQNGIRKYGTGRWTVIVNEPNYSFHPSRKPATLLIRAKLKGWV